ncbi:hypothetical protein KF840_07260 [bacterium]|nr:hypothetical protein [bacterium]
MAEQPEKTARGIPCVSTTFDDGSLVEMVYRPEERRTAFVVWRDDGWTEVPYVERDGARLVPYSPRNNLITNSVVVFPSEPAEYGSVAELVAEVQAYIHRYIDLSPLFEQIAAYYVLFTWVYDAFNELPYLRVRGDYGSGKTRFLLVIGSLCYKPIFASGASTVSPLFRLLDTFRGTLVIDESDFRVSDERAEVVKILNNGNGRGFPVLRSELAGKGEYDPRAYHVFGPKLVATRGFFEDRALESRCLSEEMGQRELRVDVPISLSRGVADEALALRNKLLLFRFRNLARCGPADQLIDRSIEPRLNQIFVPLMSVVEDADVRGDLKELARQYQLEMVADRGLTTEAQVLEVVRETLLAADEPHLAVKDITARFAERFGDEYERKVTARWIGGVLRRKLRLPTERRHGAYVIPREAFPQIARLTERYGLGSDPPPEQIPDPLGDFG